MIQGPKQVQVWTHHHWRATRQRALSSGAPGKGLKDNMRCTHPGWRGMGWLNCRSQDNGPGPGRWTSSSKREDLWCKALPGAFPHDTGTPEQLHQVVPGDLACKPHLRSPGLPTMPG